MIDDKQTKQAKAWLLALAEAKCPEPKYHSVNNGNYWAYNEPSYIEHRTKCSGLDPRTEMFRVTCDKPGLHDHPGHGNPLGMACPIPYVCAEHVNCNGTRPLTPAEAESKALKILDTLSEKGWTLGKSSVSGLYICEYVVLEENSHRWVSTVGYETELLAIFAAVASKVGLAMTEPTTTPTP